MRERKMYVLGGASLLGVMTVATLARAETQAMHVRYDAPAGCSSRAAFVRELGSRTARVHVVETSEAGAILLVELTDHGARIMGELRLLELDGTETTRAVAGATCEEVVSALALIAAVLVDPEASKRERAAPAPVPAPVAEPGWRLRPSFAAGAAATSAVGPGVSLGGWLSLGLEAERDGRRGPALAATLEHFASTTADTPAGDAELATTLGRLTLCPWRWPSTGGVFLAPCAAFEAGVTKARGARTLGERSYSVLWLAVDPVLALAYRPLPFLSLDLDAMATFPLVRDDYIFAPNIPAYSVPVVGFGAKLGVKAVWP